MADTHKIKSCDLVLVGAGIMSATLAMLVKELEPNWRIRVYESLSDVAQESSNSWNNAGTGHSALCEPNYTPEVNNAIQYNKAVKISEQFQLSRQFWSYLVEQGLIQHPRDFIHPIPHVTFVRGGDGVAFLKKRFSVLKDKPFFSDLEYIDDRNEIEKLLPLLVYGRDKSEKIALSSSLTGTDVDYGALTEILFNALKANNVKLYLNNKVTDVKKIGEKWQLKVNNLKNRSQDVVSADFVFIGAGGGTLPLLQKSKIPEIRGYGGFPISGQFFITKKPELIAKHNAKVYGKADISAPPMSVPHLDARVIAGKKSLLFGPYAGFSPNFLKSSSWIDLPKSVRTRNLAPMLLAAGRNLQLVSYLVTQLFSSQKRKFADLLSFVPSAEISDWRLISAGQRVQTIKPDSKKGGTLQFGTEVIIGDHGKITGLLGASPGASVAASVMLDMLLECFPNKRKSWQKKLSEMLPDYGVNFLNNPQAAIASLERTSAILELNKHAI